MTSERLKRICEEAMKSLDKVREFGAISVVKKIGDLSYVKIYYGNGEEIRTRADYERMVALAKDIPSNKLPYKTSHDNE